MKIKEKITKYIKMSTALPIVFQSYSSQSYDINHGSIYFSTHLHPIEVPSLSLSQDNKNKSKNFLTLLDFLHFFYLNNILELLE